VRPALLALILGLAAASPVAAGDEVAPAGSWREVIEAAHRYRASLERVLAFHERTVADAEALAARRTELLERGLVARRELDESRERLRAARGRVDDTRREIHEAELLAVEAAAAESVAAPPAAPEVAPAPAAPPVREASVGVWSMARAAAVAGFFERRFGRPLPVSAWGQTAVHDRLGFDHRNALDVALHPDSPEGQALLVFLRDAGIPFVAFRGALGGASTGAHIHIGHESARLATRH
jgi:hypothetical protein